MLCFEEICAEQPSFNSRGLLVVCAAAGIGCCIALAQFGIFAACRVNAVCMGGGRRICTSDLPLLGAREAKHRLIYCTGKSEGADKIFL